MKTKAEVRSPKSERNPKTKARKAQQASAAPRGSPTEEPDASLESRFRISGFGFPSDFGIRNSDFQPARRAVLVALACLLTIAVARQSPAGPLAQFRTVFGDIEVELFDQDKPVTVQNFIRYVESGRYQDSFSHRLMPGFVLQGGGFAVAHRGATNATVAAVPTYAPITNEFAVGRRFSNVFGTIAMAKVGGDTNSASSQWFFNLANNAFLDATDTNNLFVVFGRVVSGTNVLNIFNGFRNFDGTQQSNLVANVDPLLNYYFYPNFAACPLLRPAFAQTNLVFLDITLLRVAVTTVTGGQEISWNSAAGMANVVEFTTNLPPVWSTLLRTNGTGARMAVVDRSAAPWRFYRVRVDY